MNTVTSNQPVVKQFKFSLKGLTVPKQTLSESGAVGKYIEKLLIERKVKISDGVVDIPEYRLEVKSRNKDSKSPHTVGTMTLDDILKTSFKDSAVEKKMQYQYRVEYDNTRGVITEDRIYNFTSDIIQAKIESAYDAGKSELAALKKSGKKPTATTFGNQYGFFEEREKNQYAFRIPDAAMRGFLSTSRSSDSTKSLFDIQGELLLAPPAKINIAAVNNGVVTIDADTIKNRTMSKPLTLAITNIWDQYV